MKRADKSKKKEEKEKVVKAFKLLSNKEQKAEIKRVRKLLKYKSYVAKPNPSTPRSAAYDTIQLIFNAASEKEVLCFYFCPLCEEKNSVIFSDTTNGTNFLIRHHKSHMEAKKEDDENEDIKDGGVEENSEGDSSTDEEVENEEVKKEEDGDENEKAVKDKADKKIAPNEKADKKKVAKNIATSGKAAKDKAEKVIASKEESAKKKKTKKRESTDIAAETVMRQNAVEDNRSYTITAKSLSAALAEMSNIGHLSGPVAEKVISSLLPDSWSLDWLENARTSATLLNKEFPSSVRKTDKQPEGRNKKITPKKAKKEAPKKTPPVRVSKRQALQKLSNEGDKDEESDLESNGSKDTSKESDEVSSLESLQKKPKILTKAATGFEVRNRKGLRHFNIVLDRIPDSEMPSSSKVNPEIMSSDLNVNSEVGNIVETQQLGEIKDTNSLSTSTSESFNALKYLIDRDAEPDSTSESKEDNEIKDGDEGNHEKEPVALETNLPSVIEPVAENVASEDAEMKDVEEGDHEKEPVALDTALTKAVEQAAEVSTEDAEMKDVEEGNHEQDPKVPVELETLQTTGEAAAKLDCHQNSENKACDESQQGTDKNNQTEQLVNDDTKKKDTEVSPEIDTTPQNIQQEPTENVASVEEKSESMEVEATITSDENAPVSENQAPVLEEDKIDEQLQEMFKSVEETENMKRSLDIKEPNEVLSGQAPNVKSRKRNAVKTEKEKNNKKQNTSKRTNRKAKDLGNTTAVTPTNQSSDRKNDSIISIHDSPEVLPSSSSKQQQEGPKQKAKTKRKERAEKVSESDNNSEDPEKLYQAYQPAKRSRKIHTVQ